MKNILFASTLFLTISLQAQHTISGTFSPQEDYTWLIAYHQQPENEVYVADTAIVNGNFSMTIPENSPKGIYRLVYAVPQEEYFFDIIYSGKENVIFNFEPSKGVVFTTSQENILFSTYFNEIQDAQRDLIVYYTNAYTDLKMYQNITEKYNTVQDSFLDKSVGLLAHNFIEANSPYIPQRFEPLEEYVKNRKEKYFDSLDVSNPLLQSSRFLTDKLSNFVFTALPVEEITAEQTELAMVHNLKTLEEKLGEVSNAYKFNLFHAIWSQATNSNFNLVADTVLNDYLKPTATNAEQRNSITGIEVQNRLRLGAVAPEIEWNEGEMAQSLSKLTGGENYLLIFWSSTCGHCLRELPALHKRLKGNTSVKVVAVGLEDDEINWKVESAKLENFEHAIALGKWDNNYAALYGINSTPTYFILDKDKQIIAKPENDKEVISFLEQEK